MHLDFPTPHCEKPPGAGPFPIAIVLHDIFGVDEQVREVCQKLAEDGYFAVAPDLFARQGDVQSIPDVKQILSKVVSKVPDSQVIADLDAVVRWLKTQGDISSLAMTGFGWGGHIVWLYAAHSKQLKAGAVWYGRPAAVPLKAPVIGFYGGKDASIPLAGVEKMRARLKAPSEIVVYDNADHAFNADHGPTYNEQAAADAWRRMLAFFGEHLK